jgi:hypothetical protein
MDSRIDSTFTRLRRAMPAMTRESQKPANNQN